MKSNEGNTLEISDSFQGIQHEISYIQLAEILYNLGCK